MVSVLSRPSRTSTSRAADLSMCEYSFIARTSSEIRPVLCPTSPASVAKVSVAPLQRVEKDGCAGDLGYLTLQSREMLFLSGGEAFVMGEGCPLGLQALLSQVLRRSPSRRRRVVQLMGEARRELAQGRHLLLL